MAVIASHGRFSRDVAISNTIVSKFYNETDHLLYAVVMDVDTGKCPFDARIKNLLGTCFSKHKYIRQTCSLEDIADEFY